MFIRDKTELPLLYPLKIRRTLLVGPDSSPPSQEDLALSVLLIKVYHQSSGGWEITFAVFSLSAYDCIQFDS
jgi:hypothetical protein